MSFELAWKVLKDYLEYEEFEVKSPRQTIKQAFQIELIEDIIRVYLPELDKMYEKLLKEV